MRQQAMKAGGFAASRPRLGSRIERIHELITEVGDAVRRTYQAAMRRAAVRRSLHAGGRDHQLDKARSRAYAEQSALMVVARQMGRLAANGATLEELLRFPETLYEHAFQLVGDAPRELDAIDLEEERVASVEDVLQMCRRVRGETPEGNREEADVRSRLATINSEAARALRLHAMLIETSKGCVA